MQYEFLVTSNQYKFRKKTLTEWKTINPGCKQGIFNFSLMDLVEKVQKQGVDHKRQEKSVKKFILVEFSLACEMVTRSRVGALTCPSLFNDKEGQGLRLKTFFQLIYLFQLVSFEELTL